MSPCQGPCPNAATAVNSIISGTLPMYPATITSALAIVARIYPRLLSLYIPFHFPTRVGVKISAIIRGIFTAHANTPNRFLFLRTHVQ